MPRGQVVRTPLRTPYSCDGGMGKANISDKACVAAFGDFHSARAATKVRGGNADRTCMNLSAIALQGLHQAGARLESAGSKIASFAASSADAANRDTVDLSAAVVALLSAKNLYSANLRSVKTADEILKTSIDLIA
jgi:hypothetical protein